LNVKAGYESFSREKLMDKIYDLGSDFERYSGSCSQCTVAALHEVLGFDDILVKVATSSCGGQATQVVGTCGAVIGGTLVLDYYFGRTVDQLSHKREFRADMETMKNAVRMAQILTNKFVGEYGSIVCPQIQTRLFGRSFDLKNPEEFEQFEKAGGHSDPTKCMAVVGRASRWTMEILLDKGVIVP
jgi:C_GCAxxG_C_C family probable redox protein